MSGPIGIVKEGGDYISQFGFPFGLMISALLSVMLAIINILPVPMLDGGHLLFLAIEAIKDRPVNKALQERLVQVCFVMLMGLMVFIMWNDINKYFLSEWLDKEPGKPQQTQPNDSQSPQKSTVQAHPATESVR
ncbi:MAG: site-2 protease family protein [Vampirovibrionales bacterium]